MAAKSGNEFFPYEKMSDRLSTNPMHSKKLDSIKKWIATEKVHGANFSFTVSEDSAGKAEICKAQSLPSLASHTLSERGSGTLQ
jgi:hypothetical protein